MSEGKKIGDDLFPGLGKGEMARRYGVEKVVTAPRPKVQEKPAAEEFPRDPMNKKLKAELVRCQNRIAELESEVVRLKRELARRQEVSTSVDKTSTLVDNVSTAAVDRKAYQREWARQRRAAAKEKR